MQGKKVLIISTVGLIYDGITNVILSCLAAMNRDGLDLYIASTIQCEQSIKSRFEELGCKVVPFSNRRKEPSRYFFELVRFIKKQRIEIVHAHGNSATLAVEMVAAWLGGAKKRIAHSHNTRCDQVKADKILRPLFNLFYTEGLACGNEAGKWLFGNRPFTILNNGRDINKFSYNPDMRTHIRQQLGLKENELAFGHVGNFVAQKNHAFLIDIFREILKLEPTAKFYLVGDGPEKKEIEKKLGKLNVTFVGTIDNVNEFINAMDSMIFPSLFEGLPLVAIEWQLNGVPTLAADTITDSCKLIDNFCFYSLNYSAEKWAKKAIYMAVIYRNQRQECSQMAKLKAVKSGFDINSSAEKLREIYLSQ